MTQDEISIGRGGDDCAGEPGALHQRRSLARASALRRDPPAGRFVIVDKSMNGTWLNGKRLTRGVEEDASRPGADRRGRSDHAHFEAKQ